MDQFFKSTVINTTVTSLVVIPLMSRFVSPFSTKTVFLDREPVEQLFLSCLTQSIKIALLGRSMYLDM